MYRSTAYQIDRRFFLLFLLFLLPFQSAVAMSGDTLKTSDSTNTGYTRVDLYALDFSIPSVFQLIDSALTHSPVLRMSEHQIRKAHFNLKKARVSWLDAASVNYDSKIGSFANNELEQLSYGHSTGFGVKFSLFDVLNHKNTVGMAAQERLIAEEQLEIQRQGIRTLVIEQYNEVMLTQKNVEILSRSKEALGLHLQMAEQEFLQGEIPISELARVTDMCAKSELDFERAKREYWVAIALLEELIGVKLNQF